MLIDEYVQYLIKIDIYFEGLAAGRGGTSASLGEYGIPNGMLRAWLWLYRWEIPTGFFRLDGGFY